MPAQEFAYPQGELQWNNDTEGFEPVQVGGMLLRDFFAINAPTDSIQELIYRCLSEDAKEKLTGMKRSEKFNGNDRVKNVEYQLAELEFNCAVDAAIRYKMADAMLKEREVQRG